MNTNKPIALVYHHIPPFSGAVAMRFKSIEFGLKKAGFKANEVLVYTAKVKESMPISSYKTIVFNGSFLSNSKGLMLRSIGEFLFGLQVGFRLILKRPRIAVISSPLYLSSIIIGYACYIFRIRYILEVRDLYPQAYADTGLLVDTSITYRFFEHLSRSICRRAEAIISLTKGIENEVSERCRLSNVKTIYNGFPSQVEKIQNAKHSKFTVCFHGVLGFYQDINSLLILAKSLKSEDIDFVVIGYGHKSEQVRKVGLNNLRFLGQLSNNSTLMEAARCHIGISLRSNDALSKISFPVKIWEYLGLGLPVIVAPQSEAGNFVTDNNCGFQFEPSDIEAIKNTIIDLKNNQQLLLSMSKNGLGASKIYTREKMGERFVGFLTKIL
ncbi:MAG: glycosyltransferase family 4 protein [Porticoccaceae bacterium]